MALSIWQTCQQDGWPGLVAFLLCLCVDAAAFRAQILFVVVLFLTSETAFLAMQGGPLNGRLQGVLTRGMCEAWEVPGCRQCEQQMDSSGLPPN